MTDSENEIRFDPENKPGVSNLLTILSALSGRSVEEEASKLRGLGYGALKDAAAEAVIGEFKPIQEKYQAILDDRDALALILKKPKRILWGIAGVTFLHWLILYVFGSDPGWSTLEGNISGKIDIALLGENHVYHGYGIPFDPEGLLGAISGAGTVLLGYFIGQMIRHTDNKTEAVAKLYTTAAICLALGCVWSIWLPISKPLWTGSYVLYAGGWAILCLAFFVWFIDVKGKEKVFLPFKAMGMNPLFAFVMAGLTVKIFGRMIHWTAADGSNVTPLGWFYKNCCVSIFGNNEYASLMYAICYVALFLLMALWLYRKKIIIKL